MPYRYRTVFFLVILLSACSSPPPLSVHDQLRQHLLEAEFGSVISIHFAKKPMTPLPPSTPIKKLFNQLRSNLPSIRWSAADQLAYSQNKKVTKALINAMLDAKGTQRVCVMATALGHLKDPRALSPLTQAAFNPSNRDLRLCAIRALGMIGDKRVIPSLIKALKENNMPLQAASSLARFGDKRALQALISAATRPGIRYWILMDLGELGQPGALPFLQQQLALLNKQAVKSASDKTGSQNRRTAKMEAVVIKTSIWKIQQLSANHPVQVLSRILRNNNVTERRNWAAYRLGEMKQPQAITALISVLNKNTPESLQGRAAAALVRIGAQVLAPLRSALQKRPVDPFLLAVAGYIAQPTDIKTLTLIKRNNSPPRAATITESIQLIKQRFHSQ